MGIGLDLQLRLWSAATLTTTAVSTNAWDQSTAGRHAELGDAIGMAIFPSAAAASGTETYEFQAISATASDLTTGQVVLSTTGTMENTDGRLSTPFFLDIPPGRTLEFIGGKFVGANSSSIVVDGYLMNRAQFQQYQAEPANFTP